MAKTRIQFLCRQCGSVHPKWMGKCPDCGSWDALEEYKAPTFDARAAAVARVADGGDGGATHQTGDLTRAGEALPIDQIDEGDVSRLPCGINEFDRILGGGIVPGSAVLVGGEPGIGKSTLLLQVARGASRRESDEATKRRSDEGGRRSDRKDGRRILFFPFVASSLGHFVASACPLRDQRGKRKANPHAGHAAGRLLAQSAGAG